MDAPKFQWQALLTSILISIILSLVLWGISALLRNAWGIVIPWWAWIIITLVFFFLFYYIMQKYAYNKAVKQVEETKPTVVSSSPTFGYTSTAVSPPSTFRYTPTAVIG